MNNEREELEILYKELESVAQKVCKSIGQNNERVEQYEPLLDISTNLVFLKHSKSLDENAIKHLTDINHNCHLLAKDLKSNNYNADLVKEVKTAGFKAFLAVRK